jgi:Ca2+-dependent lipid-binding protein
MYISGLSDPFCEVQVDGKLMACTVVIHNTLAPAWDEILVLIN